MAGSAPGAPHALAEAPNRQFILAIARLNVVISAVGMGLAAGGALFMLTHISIAMTGDQAGRYLNLLGVFMPGYVATPSGAWLGLLWGLAYGGLSGGLLAWLYARTLGDDIIEHAIFRAGKDRDLRPSILLISGHAVGIALGAMFALQLVVTTGWLILRGTAAESPHAALLSNYLWGYSTTFGGAVIGAVDLFILVYLSATITCAIYNRLARWRHRRGDNNP